MKFSPLALAGAIALMSAGASAAQPAPQSPEHGHDARAMHAQHRPDPAAMAERRAEHLRAALQLRPDQDAALSAYTSALKPPSGEARDRMKGDRGEARNLTTPQRLDRMQARMAEHQARFARAADATRRFYAALTPSQQKAFDAMGPMGGGHGRMHKGHDHGERGEHRQG